MILLILAQFSIMVVQIVGIMIVELTFKVLGYIFQLLVFDLQLSKPTDFQLLLIDNLIVVLYSSFEFLNRISATLDLLDFVFEQVVQSFQLHTTHFQHLSQLVVV
jgi:hypothetical protein